MTRGPSNEKTFSQTVKPLFPQKNVRVHLLKINIQILLVLMFSPHSIFNYSFLLANAPFPLQMILQLNLLYHFTTIPENVTIFLHNPFQYL